MLIDTGEDDGSVLVVLVVVVLAKRQIWHLVKVNILIIIRINFLLLF